MDALARVLFKEHSKSLRESCFANFLKSRLERVTIYFTISVYSNVSALSNCLLSTAPSQSLLRTGFINAKRNLALLKNSYHQVFFNADSHVLET
jgi:hypothetical protein